MYMYLVLSLPFTVACTHLNYTCILVAEPSKLPKDSSTNYMYILADGEPMNIVGGSNMML